jgi:hypothetical protein
MKRPMIFVCAALLLAGCGASKLSEAPHASSLVACFATRDAARAASDITHTTTGKYPTDFGQLTNGPSPALIRPKGVTAAGRTMHGPGWTLTMQGGGTRATTFVCASAPITSTG